jgi:anti-sigma factor RsiW
MVASCKDFRVELSAYVDNELDEDTHARVGEHLRTCGSCAQEHDSIKKLSRVLGLGQAAVAEKAPDLWSLVAGKLPSVCQSIEDDLSAYLDGELLAPAKEGVSLHLEKCPSCLEKFHQLSKVTVLLSKGLELPASVEVDLWANIKTQLNDDCLLIKNDISAFIDKEVATLRHRTVTHHLIECHDCTNEFEGLSKVGDAVRTHYQPEISEDFDLWPQIKARMNVLPFEPRKPQVSTRRLYMVAAAVIGGVLASILMFTSLNHPQQAESVTAEAYLIDTSLGEPADVAENVVYEHP